VLVGKLRRKLETSETWTIQSVRGIGYMLRTVPSRVADGGI